MEQSTGTIINLIPLLAVVVWAFMLYDWYRHAVNRRNLWLIIIVVTGIIGYLFFRFSPDRQ